MFADQRADNLRIQRAAVIHHPKPDRRRQTQRSHEAERVEERQDAHDAILAAEHHDLVDLIDVRAEVVVRVNTTPLGSPVLPLEK